MDMMQDIVEFHTKFGQYYEGKPRVLPDSLFRFRHKFMLEEIEEYEAEQVILEEELFREDRWEERFSRALEKQLDALVDATYVVLGTAQLQFGEKAFNEAWRRVHAANMAKERANPDGDDRSHRDAAHDIVKPEGWTPPDHSDLIKDHAHHEG